MARQNYRASLKEVANELFFYDTPVLPEGFQLPADYINASTKHKALDLEPWRLLSKDMALSLSYYGAMLIKFPEPIFIPFAIIQDETVFYNDGWIVLACFDGPDKSGDPAFKIYDFSNPKNTPFDNLGYSNFSAWLEAAKKEAASYKNERNEG